MEQLAPAQCSKPPPGPARDDDEGFGDYNIWYHSRPNKRQRLREERGVQRKTRCVPVKHEGRTRGGAASDICVFFAQGCCHAGHQCRRRHVIPRLSEALALHVQHDVFGRSRQATEGDDQDGPGSVLKENKTIFVGGLGPADCTTSKINENFAPIGPIVQIRPFPGKSIAFVQFEWRASAEFAKEAMNQQKVGDSVVSVRWAREDPNPRAVAAAMAATKAYVAEQVTQTLPPGALQHFPIVTTKEGGGGGDAYPDTDHQFSSGAAAGIRMERTSIDGANSLDEAGLIEERLAAIIRRDAVKEETDNDSVYPDTDSQFQKEPARMKEPAPPCNQTLPQGWTWQLDPTSQTAYYIHLSSGHTQWEYPSPLSSGITAGTADAVKTGILNAVAESGGASLSLLSAYASDSDSDNDVLVAKE